MIQNIIPTPKKVEFLHETKELPCTAICTHAPWQQYMEPLFASFEKIFRLPLHHAEGGITLVYDPALPPKSYRLDSRVELELSASDEEGILYAIATLLQAVEVQNGTLTVEKGLIEDWPEKDYRCLMVDLAREWHPADKLFKYVDLCFMLKIRYLHLHFIDDQRYTLPSAVFPEISSPQHYTFEELAALRAYAGARGIILVPEFEAPGHAASLTRSYPEVFANQLTGDAQLVTEAGAVITAKSLVCAGSEATMKGIRALLEEICQLFPESPYLHIGGDEANIKAWNYCNTCKAYMAQNNIKDEYELYSDFVGRVAQAVLDLGRTPIVWEGFPKKGSERIPKETIVIAWESHYQLAGDLLESGFKIINGSWQPLYIVPSLTKRWTPFDILNWNVYNWQHFWEKSAATLNPIHVSPTEQVLGGQLSAWECTHEQEMGRIIENLPALAERTWSVQRHLTDGDYNRCYKALHHRLVRLIQDV